MVSADGVGAAHLVADVRGVERELAPDARPDSTDRAAVLQGELTAADEAVDSALAGAWQRLAGMGLLVEEGSLTTRNRSLAGPAAVVAVDVVGILLTGLPLGAPLAVGAAAAGDVAAIHRAGVAVDAVRAAFAAGGADPIHTDLAARAVDVLIAGALAVGQTNALDADLAVGAVGIVRAVRRGGRRLAGAVGAALAVLAVVVLGALGHRGVGGGGGVGRGGLGVGRRGVRPGVELGVGGGVRPRAVHVRTCVRRGGGGKRPLGGLRSHEAAGGAQGTGENGEQREVAHGSLSFLSSGCAGLGGVGETNPCY